MYKNYPYLQGNHDCVKEVFTRELWELQAEVDIDEQDDDFARY